MNELIPPQFHTRFQLLVTFISQKEQSKEIDICSIEPLTTKLETLSLKLEKFLHQFASSDAKILLNCVFREEYYQEFAAINQIMLDLAVTLNVAKHAAFATMRFIDLQFQRELLEMVAKRMIKSVKSMEREYVNDSLLKNIHRFIFSQREYLEDFLKANRYLQLSVSEEVRLRKEEATMFGQLTLLQQRKKKVGFQANLDQFVAISRSRDEAEPVRTTTKSFSSIVKTKSKIPMPLELPKSILDFLLPKGTLVMQSKMPLLLGRFGEGFTATFREKFEVFMKAVPIEEIHLEATKTSSIVESMENELLILQMIGSYPTIISCYGCILEGSSLQVIYKLPTFGSLETLLLDETIKCVPFPLIIAWLYNLADALQFLHTHGIIHQSVRSGHCYLYQRLLLKLAHFEASYSIYDVTMTTSSSTRSPTSVSAVTDIATNVSSSSDSEEGLFGSGSNNSLEKTTASVFQSDIEGFWTTTIEMLSRQPRQEVLQRISEKGIEVLLREEKQKQEKSESVPIGENGKSVYSSVWHTLIRLYNQRDCMTSMELRDELYHLVEVELKGDPREKDNLSHHRKMRYFATEYQESTSFLQYSEVYPKLNGSDSKKKHHNQHPDQAVPSKLSSPRHLMNNMLESAKQLRNSFRFPSSPGNSSTNAGEFSHYRSSLDLRKGLGRKSLSASDLSAITTITPSPVPVSLTSRGPLLIDYRKEMIQWLVNTVQLSAAVAEEVAVCLLKQGLVTIEQVRRKYREEEKPTFITHLESVMEPAIWQQIACQL